MVILLTYQLLAKVGLFLIFSISAIKMQREERAPLLSPGEDDDDAPAVPLAAESAEERR